MIRARAPLRISFGGGGTDVSPYCEDFGGLVVNATINHYVWATLEYRKDQRVVLESFDLKRRVEYDNVRRALRDTDTDIVNVVIRHFRPNFGFNFFLRSDVPPQAGLGGSAAAFAAVIGVFNHLRREKKLGTYEIAELAFRLEREQVKNPGGRQDQYASVFGGVNFMEFRGNDFVRVNPMKLERATILELEKQLVLIYIGGRKRSGNVITDQVKRYQEKKGSTTKALHATKKIAILMRYSLLRNDLAAFGALLDRAWREKKRFSPLVSNPLINRLYRIAKRQGAYGGKITGAGGGGHMHFFCRPNTEQLVARALEEEGTELVDFSFDHNGLETWECS